MNPLAVVGGAVGHTASDGRFNLVGFEGIDYFVHANIYLKPRCTPYCAEVRILKASEATVPESLVMVLTRMGEVCRGE